MTAPPNGRKGRRTPHWIPEYRWQLTSVTSQACSRGRRIVGHVPSDSSKRRVDACNPARDESYAAADAWNSTSDLDRERPDIEPASLDQRPSSPASLRRLWNESRMAATSHGLGDTHASCVGPSACRRFGSGAFSMSVARGHSGVTSVIARACTDGGDRGVHQARDGSLPSGMHTMLNRTDAQRVVSAWQMKHAVIREVTDMRQDVRGRRVCERRCPVVVFG